MNIENLKKYLSSIGATEFLFKNNVHNSSQQPNSCACC